MAELKIKNLNEKMNPHFLFNTLNLIHSYISHKPKISRKAIKYLSGNFDYIIGDSEKQLVELSKEKDFVVGYLNLLQMRFPNTFKYSVHIPKKMDTLPIPPLSLQPIIENSYKHGIRHIKRTGEIRIEGYPWKDGGILKITDNGKGFADTMVKSRTLENISERFAYYYTRVSILKNNNLKQNGSNVKIVFFERKQDSE